MYTHYTAIFVLAGQALWALAAHPALWRRLALSTAGAAVAYLPWLPSYFDDADSPGSSLIAVLQPFSADAVRRTFSSGRSGTRRWIRSPRCPAGRRSP